MKLLNVSRVAVATAALLLNGLAAGAEVKCLGMTLADPGGQLLKEYELPTDPSGPIIIAVHAQAYFPAGTVPTEGCAFWIVEPQAKGMLFNVTNDKTPPTYRPKSIREFAEAILACTIAPEEHERLIRQTAEAARKRAEAITDQPAERERLLKIAAAKVSPEDAGKWICRVVYNYPHNKGTMTTYLRMTKADLEKIRELLKEPTAQ